MFNRLRIPKEFELFGHTIVVEWDSNLEKGKHEAYGMSEWNKNKITLQTPNFNYTETQVEQTFLHELLHLILSNGSYIKENNNEKLVDLIASLLHQMIKTAIYSEDNDTIMKLKKDK